ncbi:MAG: hypothetical protein WDA77_13635 [Acidimicrobiia bacterium]
MNPHTNVEMVESSWNHFKTPKRVKSLVEHTSDPELVTFLLDRSGRRKTVLEAALHNWFLPEELYVAAMGNVSGEYAASIIGLADGYPKRVKTLVAKHLVAHHAEKWVVWDDTGFTDNELLELFDQIVTGGSHFVGWGTLAIEAVLFRRPHLIDQLKTPYRWQVAEVLAGSPISDDVVATILEAAENSSGLHWDALVSLYHNPWISPQNHQVVEDALTATRYSRFTRTDRICWAELTDSTETLERYWEQIRRLSALPHRVVATILADSVLMSKPHVRKWVTKIFLYNQISVHGLRWLDRDTATTLFRLLEPNRKRYETPGPLQWNYEDLQYYGDTDVWIWDFDREIHSDIPIRRTSPPKPPPPSNRNVNWAEYTWDSVIYYEENLDLAHWFLNQLGDATNPHSVALWEILFSLWPAWEHSYGELVTATKRIGGRV